LEKTHQRPVLAESTHWGSVPQSGPSAPFPAVIPCYAERCPEGGSSDPRLERYNPGAMTRSDLIARIASQWLLLNAKDVEAAVSTILSAIAAKLAEGGRAEIRGFGSFTLSHRSPRTGRNPKTGEPVSVPAKLTPHFKPGVELRQRVDRTTGAGVKTRKREEMERVA